MELPAAHKEIPSRLEGFTMSQFYAKQFRAMSCEKTAVRTVDVPAHTYITFPRKTSVTPSECCPCPSVQLILNDIYTFT